MHRLHFRLFTAVLCAMGLSGCYTQLHQYAWQRAKVVDEAWFQPAEAELYQAGDTFYTKAYHGPGRGCYAGYPFHWVMLRGTGMATFCPDEEKAEAVYLPLTKQSAADVQNSLDKGAPYVICPAQHRRHRSHRGHRGSVPAHQPHLPACRGLHLPGYRIPLSAM